MVKNYKKYNSKKSGGLTIIPIISMIIGLAFIGYQGYTLYTQPTTNTNDAAIVELEAENSALTEEVTTLEELVAGLELDVLSGEETILTLTSSIEELESTVASLSIDGPIIEFTDTTVNEYYEGFDSYYINSGIKILAEEGSTTNLIGTYFDHLFSTQKEISYDEETATRHEKWSYVIMDETYSVVISSFVRDVTIISPLQLLQNNGPALANSIEELPTYSVDIRGVTITPQLITENVNFSESGYYDLFAIYTYGNNEVHMWYQIQVQL